MRRSKKSLRRLNEKKRSRLYLALAFLIPFIGMCAVMVAFRAEPFGNHRALLYCDEYHQYYPFFKAYRQALLSGDSLLWNWDVGAGTEYLGLIAYYLGSPLNLLSVFVPEKWTLEFFALLVPVRLGLAGLFFAIFLKKIFNKNDISIALFGAFYGLCAWALSYQWNVMWLDTFALLPLVVLGTISLLRDKKFILYTVTLFLSVAINYYIGLFTCIFVLLVFICYEICRFRSLPRFFADLGRIAVFTVIAIGMTAFITLPTFMALQNTSSSVNKFPEGFRMNIISGSDFMYTQEAWKDYRDALAANTGFLDIAKNLIVAIGCSIPPILVGMYEVAGGMTGGMQTNFKEADGLPNIYCGVCAIVMVFLYLAADRKKIKIRDKICGVALLVFFMLSFLLRQLDYIWHGFHFTNMIPYRFSFLFSFVMLYMAYQAWTIRDSFKLWQLVAAAVLSLALVLCCDKLTTISVLAYNLVFWVLNVGLFAFIWAERKLSEKEEDALEEDKKTKPRVILKRRQFQSSLLLTVVVGLELILNLVNFGCRFTYTNIGNYPRGTQNAASAISYMKYRERNTLFYRAEVSQTQTYNDGALNGYHGITTFASSVNSKTTSFMECLGLGAMVGANRYAYEETSPVTNLFLNLKYMIEREGNVKENSYFDNIYNFGDVYLLENNAYLPLGFLTNSELQDWEVSTLGNSFDRQEEMFNLATGLNSKLWFRIPDGCISISSEDVDLFNTDAANGYTAYSKEDEGTINYTFTMTHDGLLCLEVDVYDSNSIKVYKEGKEVLTESINMTQNLSVCEVNAGDIIEVDVTCTNEKWNGSVDIDAAILNKTVFMEGYEILKASTLELTEFSNTEISGTIQCNRNGLLYTSVPSDGNWEVEVDGEPAEVILVGDVMTAVDLTEGEHEVTLRYRSKAFTTGLTVSIICAVILIALAVLSRFFPHHEEKDDPKPGKKAPAEPEKPLTEGTPELQPDADGEENPIPPTEPEPQADSTEPEA